VSNQCEIPYVIGIDPGKSCGIAIMHGPQLVKVWQGPSDRIADVLTRAIPLAMDGTITPRIACERFTRRPERGNARTVQNDAERVIGIVMYVSERAGCTLSLQSPASVKKLAPNTLLKRLGLYVSAAQYGWNDANDANDAVRHAVTLLATFHATVFNSMLIGVSV
jgi:hypothetical protein